MKYRKKPVVIEAVEWTGSNLREITTFIEGVEPNTNHPMAAEAWDVYYSGVMRDGLVIKTLEGQHNATVGDMIIKGVAGEFYPCKPEIFKQTYNHAELACCESERFTRHIKEHLKDGEEVVCRICKVPLSHFSDF